MATEGFDVRISLQRLLVGLILSIVPLSILGFYITGYSEKALELAVGSHFKIITRTPRLARLGSLSTIWWW